MKTPVLKVGDIYFGWNICYEDPQAVKDITNGLYRTMGREVPVNGVDRWDSWVILMIKENTALLSPILFKKLGHYAEHQWKLDNVTHYPFEVCSSHGDALVLLGKTIWRSDKDLSGRVAGQCIFPWDARSLCLILAKTLRGEYTECGRVDMILNLQEGTMEVDHSPFPKPETN